MLMLTTQTINKIQITFLNNIIKLDPSHVPIISRLKNNKPENYIFNDEEKLWYFQNYKKKNKLIDILYPDEKIIKVEFKNNDYNDYIESNLILIKDSRFKDEFNKPDNVEIINSGKSIKIIEGKYSGQYRNMWWTIKSEKNYIQIHIKNNIYTKISLEDINKVLNISNIRPVWYLMENGYVATTLRTGLDQKIYYLHQFILDQHTKDNTDFKETVDHINQDKLDNRRENLRIVNMSEQNKNKDKQARRKDCKVNLPEGIKVLPKFVEYRKDVYDKENNKQREFFIVNHPKLEKIWETTKSNKVTIIDKLRYAKAKIELIENKLTESQFKEIIGLEEKMDLPFGIRLDIFREKYHYILDIKNDDQRYNAKMILHSTDVQEELNKFIDTVVNVKYPNLIKKYEILNPVEIDENKISTVEKKIVTEEQPIYPQYISVYEEKGSKYIQYNKQSKAGRFSKKIKILTNDIQKELDSLVLQVNEKYPGYNLDKQKIIKPELFKLKSLIV